MGASDRRQVPDVPGTQRDCKRERKDLRARPITGLPRDRSRFHPRVLYSQRLCIGPVPAATAIATRTCSFCCTRALIDGMGAARVVGDRELFT